MNIIRPDIFENTPVTALFTTVGRESEITVKKSDFGRSDALDEPSIQANYTRLFEELRLGEQSLVLAQQVHGSRVEVVEKPGIIEDTDGLVTAKAGLKLGIRVADCAAILMADPEAGVIAAVHAGWRGAADNILPAGVNAMKRVGASPDNILAYISPCISLARFEVGEEVAIRFPDQFVDRKSYKKPHIKLKSFLINQLRHYGVRRDKIECSDACTFEDRSFFSYRREREQAGRMLALITISQ